MALITKWWHCSFNLRSEMHGNDLSSYFFKRLVDFNPHGDKKSICQTWTKWVKGFNYFIKTSGTNNDNLRHLLWVHMVGLPKKFMKHWEFKKKLNNHFRLIRNIPFEGQSSEILNNGQFDWRLRQITEQCEYGQETDDNIRNLIIGSCRSAKRKGPLAKNNTGYES